MNQLEKTDIPLSSIEETAKIYNQIAPHFAVTRRTMIDEMKFLLPYVKGCPFILDVGCGTGRAYRFLKINKAIFRYQGVDISEEQVREAKKEFPEISCTVADMTALPFDNASFDIVLMIASFHHLPDRESRLLALAEAHRILKPDGIVFMTNWNLMQKKYLKYYLFALGRSLITLGTYSIKDLFIPWKNESGTVMAKRYYHSFGKREIAFLVQQSGFTILENCYTKGEKKVKMWGAYNLLTILRKS
jgi:ubiquinone/menaquinone biosynthesis C-methylase UbiE